MKKIGMLFSLVFCILFLASCKNELGEDEKLEQEGYTVIVTFHANGGSMNGEEIRFRYCKPNSRLLGPGVAGTSPATKELYSLVGWFSAVLDENGNPKKDSSGDIVLDKAWNFEHDLTKENIILYAKWQRKFTYTIQYMTEEYETKLLSKSSKVNVINTTKEITFEASLDSTIYNWTGYTFINFYADEACTLLLDLSMKHPGNYENTDLKVYVKFLEGNFVRVRTAEDFEQVKANSKVILENDIDFTGAKWINLSLFTGRIYGNHFKIKNLNVHYTDKYGELGLFTFLDGAKIQDVIFEDCSVKVTYTKKPHRDLVNSIGFLAGKSENSEIKNVTFTNCKLEISGYKEYSIVVSVGNRYLFANDQETNLGNTLSNIKGQINSNYNSE